MDPEITMAARRKCSKSFETALRLAPGDSHAQQPDAGPLAVGMAPLLNREPGGRAFMRLSISARRLPPPAATSGYDFREHEFRCTPQWDYRGRQSMTTVRGTSD
jgi:hypothetical protein